MAINRPDEYRHQNPDLAIADSRNVRGGRRVVADRAALYALASKADQLQENVTIVRILSDADNGGGATEVLLVDDSSIGNANGWQIYSSGSATPGSGGGTPAIYADFSFTVETDGAQSFALPSGTLGVSDVLQVVQTPLLPPTDNEPDSTAKDRGIRLADFRFSQGNLLVDANANLKQGDILIGRRVYGGVPTTGGGDAGGDTGGDTGGEVGDPYTDDKARAANEPTFDELRAQIAQLQDYVFAQNLDIDPDQRTADVGPGDDYTFTTEPLN